MLEIESTQGAVIFILTMLAEARDQETGGHMQRTQSFVKVLAEKLQIHKIILTLFESAFSHDIGKISVPDYILKKSGKLIEEKTLDMMDAFIQIETRLKKSCSNIAPTYLINYV